MCTFELYTHYSPADRQNIQITLSAVQKRNKVVDLIE